MSEELLFQPLQAVIEPAFWGALGDLKLQKLKLSEDPITFWATYMANNHPRIPGILTIGAAGLESPPAEPTAACIVHGTLYCLNTLESLATYAERVKLMERIQKTLSNDILLSSEAPQSPARFQPLVMLAYCDLKHYRYHFSLASPVICPPTPFRLLGKPLSMVEHFGNDDISGVADEVIKFVADYASTSACTAAASSGFFLLKVGSQKSENSTCSYSCAPLLEWHVLNSARGQYMHETMYLVFGDPSTAPEHPGWPLRNVLMYASAHWPVPELLVLCLRSRRGRFDAGASTILRVGLPTSGLLVFNIDELPPLDPGWHGCTTPGEPRTVRVADLSSSMDPHRLAASAVDLNLQLMRWRAAPDIDLDRISSAKCLLLGAGTLGCSVARVLLAWGVRYITFVDNSRVSFSNPVRQSLFNHEDCLHGGKPKALAAAEALQRIFPDVQALGEELTIPMPGHPPCSPDDVESMRNALERLHTLVDAHDVIFLLLDTREARWAPTLMAAAAGKLAITAALGFDEYVVMLHGGQPGNSGLNAVDTSSQKLFKKGGDMRQGCYYCFDVVAPMNSTVGRSLDQQCTVARPGLSSIAGALAVEMAVAVLAHPKGVWAPAPHTMDNNGEEAEESLDSGQNESPLGAVPHMIRGQLTGFSNLKLTGAAFPQCPGCSSKVVNEYLERGTDFIFQAVSQSGYLDEFSGLAELRREAEAKCEATAAQAESLGFLSKKDARDAGISEAEHLNESDLDWTEL